VIDCRFAPECQAPSAARVSVPGGCICFPADREQELCLQHINDATPLDGLELLVDRTETKFFQRGGKL
jgi:hypothetical protein